MRLCVSVPEWMKQRAALLLVGLFVGAMTLGMLGCNTTRGVGEDVEAAGEGIQDAAD